MVRSRKWSGYTAMAMVTVVVMIMVTVTVFLSDGEIIA